MLGSICCMQTYFYLEEFSRHYQSYWQRSATRKMTGKYLYTTIAHERKRTTHISFKDLDLLYHLMPSNNLTLGLYELSILKRTFPLTTDFCRFREGERRRLLIGDNFLQQLGRSGVSSTRRESSSILNRKAGHTHTHTHTHAHTYTLAPPSLLSFSPFTVS